MESLFQGRILEFHGDFWENINYEKREKLILLFSSLEKKGYTILSSEITYGEIKRTNYFGGDPVNFLVCGMDLKNFDKEFKKLTKKFGLENLICNTSDPRLQFNKTAEEHYKRLLEGADEF
jgi:hypothetical protein